MDNQEKSTFSLDDEEIVEEEVTERDEEYDDGYEDDYDDDYDDEEDYEDEEYDDEGDYDDGYNDDYYDDRLNKVLDEIAELKRGMVPATVQQPPILPPQYIYQPTGAVPPSAGSEVVMYNEISRLRDELAKNSSSLEMQKEITRMKEDMARDQKIAETQYRAEIERLQDKIDDLLKNGSSPQSELPAEQEPARIEGAKSIPEIDKLLSINESILLATRDSDARIQGELDKVKKQLEDIPSLKELNSAVSSVKKAATNSAGIPSDVVTALSNDIASLRAALKDRWIGASGVNSCVSDDINSSELLRQLYDIKAVLGSASEQAEKHILEMNELVNEFKKVSVDVHSQSVTYKDKLISAYDYAKKLASGNEPDAVDLLSATCALIAELNAEPLTRAVFTDLQSYCSERGIMSVTPVMRDNVEKFFALADKISSAQVEAYSETLPDLVSTINVLENNAKQANNAEIVENITKILLAETVENEGKEKARGLVGKLVGLTVADLGVLPKVDNTIVYNVKSDEENKANIFAKLEELKSTVLDTAAALAQSVQEIKIANAERAESEAKEKEAEQAQESQEAQKDVEIQEVEVKAAETKEAEQEIKPAFDAEATAKLLAAIDDLKVQISDVATAVAESNKNKAESETKSETETEPVKEVAAETVAPDYDFSSAFDELRSNYIDISGKLIDISEKIQEPPAVDAPIMTDDEKQEALTKLEYIRSKMDEYNQFVSQIPELRDDILAFNPNIDISEPLAEQANSLITEITSQFDKLYEDLSNVIIESEANIVNRLGESLTFDSLEAVKADILNDTQAIKDSLLTVTDAVYALPLADSVENAKADILADTQAIKDSISALNDAVLTPSVADAVEQLRADVSSYTATVNNNSEAAATDRQKLLDDIAFLREQAELALSENEEIPTGATAVQDSDKFAEYLDEISARVTLLPTVADDVALTKDSVAAISDGMASVTDSVAALGDNIASITDNVAGLSDGMASVTDSVAALGENITSVTDSVAGLSDGMASVTDSVAALGDNIASINDNVALVAETVKPMSDDIIATRDAATATLDALTPIAEQLNSLLDRLDAEQEEYDVEQQIENESVGALTDDELIEIKDGLNTLLDTLPLFPQADDVIAARDNTYSILDTLSTMPLADDVAVLRDNVAAILDAVNALTDTLQAASGEEGADIDEIAVIRNAVDMTAEDVKYIRDKLDGGVEAQSNESLDTILKDLGVVVEKLEQYEATSVNNKQEIIDTVNGIREEFHINTLDETMSAAGIDDETRDALVGEIAEIRERLGSIESTTQSLNEVNVAALDGITEQLASLQALIEERATSEQYVDNGQGDAVSDMTSDNMQALIDELTAIREKLDAQSEYDTVEEILSLRDDVKAARIVDQDEVSGELEAIKNELAAISSGNILDEIRALREDLINLPSGDGSSAPTDGEINLVLNEIVSLRDEVFAFKDEVINATASIEVQPEQEETSENDEDITTIIDELTALRADQTALNENVDELKDIISRRTSIGVAEGDEQDVAPNGGMDVVLDEIINLKNDIERIEDSIGGDKFAAMTEQVDEIRAIIDELRSGAPVETEIDNVEEQTVSVDLAPIMEQFDAINAVLDDIRLNQGVVDGDESSVGSMTVAERFDELHNEIDDIKLAIDDILDATTPHDYSTEIEELRAEVEALRAENEQLRQDNTDVLSVQLAEIKDAMHDMALSMTPPATADGETSYAALIEEIRNLNDRITESQQQAPVSASLDEDTIQAIRDALATQSAPEQAQVQVGLSDELAEIRDEIAQLRSFTAVSADGGSSVEVAALRDELREIKELLSSSDSLNGVAEDVTAIKADVQTLKEEPDLGVMSEILALRDEFQALREQIEDVKRVASKTDKDADDTIMNEVQSLRDQLFAISMANVNDPGTGETNYESYNNIILDELASLRDQVTAADTVGDIATINDEIAKLKATIDKRENLYDALSERISKLNNDASNNRILDELASLRDQVTSADTAGDIAGLNDELANLKATIDKRESLYDALSERISKLNNDATNNRILDELASLRTDMANQRDADLTTLNFMSEMAHLLERQNQYLTQNAGSKITDEIESLKAEIASSDAVAEEVAKLREIMTQSGNASDNESILNELADLREELSREKPSRENALILDAIARLRDEVTVLAEREKIRDMNSDADLSDSLSDLKEQLNEIAGIIEPEEKKQEVKKTQRASASSTSSASTGNKRGRKPGIKSGNGSASKSGTKKSTASGSGTSTTKKRTKKSTGTKSNSAVADHVTVEEQQLPPIVIQHDDFEALIDEQASMLGGDSEMSLNVETIATSDAMDLADKLAKQVANKLIMEQLVEQLGDGGVSEDRVDEILRDILPQEFTTIAETEASDKVRRLANQLVLDKLRSRLNGKRNDED